MKYIGNAFSAGSLDSSMIVEFRYISLESAKEFAASGPTSCVGHADTAKLLTSMLGVDVTYNRISLSLRPGDQLLVAQYNGPRLPEGAVTLPEGAKIRWILVVPRTEV